MTPQQLKEEWQRAIKERDDAIREATTWRSLSLEDRVAVALSDLSTLVFFVSKLIDQAAAAKEDRNV